MKLGGASKSKNMLDSLIKEDHLVSIPSANKASAGGPEAAVPAAVVAASVHPVSLSVEERLSCQVQIIRHPVPVGWRKEDGVHVSFFVFLQRSWSSSPVTLDVEKASSGRSKLVALL